MPASNRYMNVPSVIITPAGGSATPWDGIQSANYSEGISNVTFSGDGNLFPILAVVDQITPKITVTSQNQFALNAIVATVGLTVAVKFGDAKNGIATSGGGWLFTGSNGYFEGRDMTSSYRQPGTTSCVFGFFSTDGTTHPVALSAL